MLRFPSNKQPELYYFFFLPTFSVISNCYQAVLIGALSSRSVTMAINWNIFCARPRLLLFRPVDAPQPATSQSPPPFSVDYPTTTTTPSLPPSFPPPPSPFTHRLATTHPVSQSPQVRPASWSAGRHNTPRAAEEAAAGTILPRVFFFFIII